MQYFSVLTALQMGEAGVIRLALLNTATRVRLRRNLTGLAPQGRLTEAGLKPPGAAVIKSHGSERSGQRVECLSSAQV